MKGRGNKKIFLNFEIPRFFRIFYLVESLKRPYVRGGRPSQLPIFQKKKFNQEEQYFV